MTKEEYAEKVRDTAVAILTECSAEAWKREQEANGDDAGFHDFYYHAEYNGSFSSILDATCGLGDYTDAIEILQVSEQNPDHVDSGLYEGCAWQRILICIAYELFSWDVSAKAEEMYNADEFEQALLPYPDTPHQKGFFPKNKKFKIPDGPWVVGTGNGIKILIAPHSFSSSFSSEKYKPKLSVVFEGPVEKRGVKSIRYIVDCRRVYNQNGNNIDDDLLLCHEEFGVRKIK